MQPTQTTHLKKVLSIFCFLATLGILICTLWPFDPFPSNRVSWLGDANGLRIQRRGVVLSHQELLRPLFQPNASCTIELWVKPAETDSVSTILNFYQPGNPWRFLIRQYLVGLIISHDIPATSGEAKRVKVDIDDGLRANQLTFITVTSGENGTSVYFDGRPKRSFPHFHISPDDLSGQLVLGSSTVQPDAWAGEIRGLTIYSRELTAVEVATSYRDWRNAMQGSNNGVVAQYQFSERAGNVVHGDADGCPSLSIPKTYRVPHHSFLTPPWREFDPTWDYFWDVFRNVLGFMPLGFFLCVLLALSGRSVQKAILFTTLLGGLLSLCVEVLQAYIPQRGSGVTDILTNTIGTLLGALLARPDSIRNGLTSLAVKSKLGGSPP